jgi:hypothetical protein
MESNGHEPGVKTSSDPQDGQNHPESNNQKFGQNGKPFWPYYPVNDAIPEPTLYCYEYCGHPTHLDIRVLFAESSLESELASANITPTSDPKRLVI